MIKVLFTIILVIVTYLLLFLRKSEKLKGRIGEKKVEHKLNKLPEIYYVFNNVYLQGKYSSQIDHVVISPYGIFVIETKNYRGNIYGGEKVEEWTQNIWGNKYSFRNPIKQNMGHVYSLMKFFNISQSYFIPIVVFTTRCNLCIDTHSIVIYANNINDKILSYHKQINSKEQVEQLSTKLTYCLSLGTKNTSEEHLKYVRERKYSYKWKIENNICPKCGGKLIERKGRYGYFLGCSNYPRCTFTHKIIEF